MWLKRDFNIIYKSLNKNFEYKNVNQQKIDLQNKKHSFAKNYFEYVILQETNNVMFDVNQKPNKFKIL